MLQNPADITALLNFYLDAGVEETIGEEPVNRFNMVPPKATVAPKEPSAVRPASPEKIKKPEAVQSTAVPSLTEGIREAEAVAKSCKTIDVLRQALEKFEYCSLKKLASHSVFAEGNAQSRLMIIDRQPSGDEDRSGRPFAGAAGELLDKMLAAIEIDRSDVYLASAIPWRPPGGRALTDEERALCLPFALRHIALVKPDFVLACGEAASYLLNQKTGVNKLRGVWKDLQIDSVRAKMLPIFHPAFLIDQPGLKKYAWSDLLGLKAAMREKQ
ncbi:MAG: uracil-DNA glycosylase [Sneathiella sp.]|uniref:uracil-DNA glycosylase n=1 Tax=Sneathiella sp. TaxID=1964365 RepID=UPI000C671164|nr:uracil-DNA glycosylase [Sneathiella sp.]MAZ02925.1 uracil-DNA glycosylase [Sneathiella sp.]